MYTSNGRRTGTEDARSFKTFFGVMMLLATAVVFFGLQVMMVGPLKSQLENIQSRLNDSEKNMRKLVAERNQLWRTNDLLSGLQQQSKTVAGIESTLASIRELREHVEHEAKATQQALAAFDSMAALHKQLAAQDAHTKMALSQLDDLIALRQSVIDAAADTQQAMAAVEKLEGLADTAIVSSSQVDDAEKSIDRLAELKYQVLGESDGLEKAEQGLTRMTALHQKLQQPNIATAEENANRLLVINDSLAAAETDEAGSTLDSLLNLESRLAARGDTVAEAVRTLEILDDFQIEIDDHIHSIEGLRRTMVEIAMLEGSIGRAARVLQPLVELSNLRRLSDNEVRAAARVILDQRATRVSQNTKIVNARPHADAQSKTRSDLVPLPPEEKEASAE